MAQKNLTTFSPSAGSHGTGWLAVIGVLVPPLVASLSLYAIAWFFGKLPYQPYSVLATLSFITTLVVYR